MRERTKVYSFAITNPVNDIKSLDLSEEIDNENLIFLAPCFYHPNCRVTSINLGLNDLNENGFLALAAALIQPYNKITTLDVGANSMSFECVKILCDALIQPKCKVTNLNLGFNELSLESIKILAAALVKSKIVSLALEDNHITKEEQSILANVLIHPENKLTELNLSNNNINSARFYEALTHPNNKIMVLNLFNVAMNTVSLKLLSTALVAPNNKITELDLSYNSFEENDRFAEALAKVFAHPNNRITSIKLCYCSMTAEDVKILFGSFTSPFCRLVEFIWEENIGNESFVINSLKDIIKHNITLTKCVPDIKIYVKRNKKIQKQIRESVYTLLAVGKFRNPYKSAGIPYNVFQMIAKYLFSTRREAKTWTRSR